MTADEMTLLTRAWHADVLAGVYLGLPYRSLKSAGVDLVPGASGSVEGACGCLVCTVDLAELVDLG